MYDLKRNSKNLTLLHESNYMKFMHVAPFLRFVEYPSLYSAQNSIHRVTITVKEITPYTSVISLKVQLIAKHKWLPEINMLIRCYHDARVAEVINFQQHGKILPRYNYPNPNMYQRNEKQQINRFFGDWLDYCLKTQFSFNEEVTSINA